MSNKGNKMSIETRDKIALIKTKHTATQLVRAGNAYFRHLEENPKELPTLAGYCLKAQVHPTNLRDYTVKHPKVHQQIETLALMQEQYCLINGIRNKANSIFAMFLLKSKHGFIDQPKTIEQHNTINLTPALMADAIALNEENKKKSGK